MKVCVISNLYPPYSRGGAEYVVYSTVKGMIELGHDVVVITTAPEDNYVWDEGKLRIYRYRPKNLFFYTHAHRYHWLMRLIWHIIDMFHISSANYVRKIVKEEKPDVVHTHNLMGMSFLIPIMIRWLGIRHLHTIHDVQLVEPSGIILKLKEKTWRYNGLLTTIYTGIMRRLFVSPDVVISPSQFLLDFYTARGFFEKSKKVMLRNPVAIHKYENTEYAYNDLVFLYIGQIEEHKGVIFLLETFLDMCRNQGICPELHIAGDGSQFRKLKEMAMGHQNVFLYGKVDRVELPKLFDHASVTIVPSLCYENSPTVIFESLSFGVPVLASRVEGVEELIREGENGLTFNTGDKESLQEKIKWCMENKEKLAEMSGNANKSLVGLSVEDYIKKLDNLYID